WTPTPSRGSGARECSAPRSAGNSSRRSSAGAIRPIRRCFSAASWAAIRTSARFWPAVGWRLENREDSAILMVSTMPALLAYFYLAPTLFWPLMLFVLGFSIYAQIRVSSAYSKNLRFPSRGGITGREAAEAVMARAGITDVEIEETGGHLTDHYDPIHNTLVLSSENYRGTSLAAVGVAAHAAGHALQHREGYRLLNFRMALVPATRIAAGLLPLVYP